MKYFYQPKIKCTFKSMLSYPLLVFLPADLLHYIYLINLHNKASTQIQKFYKNRAIKNNIIYEIINEFINYHDMQLLAVYNDPNRSIVRDRNIELLQFILDNDFSRKYDRFFWQNLTEIIIYNLMQLHNSIFCRHLNINKNFYYRNLKIASKLWFKICQKYNIKLLIHTTDSKNFAQSFQYIYARNHLPIKNLNKFIITPIILYGDEDEWMLWSDARNYLKRFILHI